MSNNEVENELELEDINTEEIANELKAAAQSSHNEEDLKMRAEHILRNEVFEILDIPWAKYEDRSEKGVFSGQKDALYGKVVIEYKRPDLLESDSEAENAKNQVIEYIQGETDEENYTDFFGVILDGTNIGFIQYRREGWEFQGPFDVTSRTVLKLIKAVRALQRKPLKVKYLLKDFGPNCELAQSVISEIYNAINNSVSPRTESLFSDWRRVFSQVCAYSPDNISSITEEYEVEEEPIDVEKLFFSVHTYYTYLMKLLSSEVVTLYADGFLGSYLQKLNNAYYKDINEMKKELKNLEEGGIFREMGIKNFLEADYFAWYLDEWDEELADKLHEVVEKLREYEPATTELQPEETRDLFKNLYQGLVPKSIRHDLGEYFTPDWLAEYILDQVGFEGNPDQRVLDPACGSGTFLVKEINRIKEYGRDKFIDKSELMDKIVKNVRGVDLNPLAVLAAKANYLIALSNLLRHRSGDFHIPVYLADSILSKRRSFLTGKKGYEIDTAVGKFRVNEELLERGIWSKLLNLIDECLKNEYSVDEYSKRFKNDISKDIDAPVELYKKFLKLEEEDKDRIWTQVIKNSFAPLLMEKFDYVIGNPPWVGWEYLPQDYRENLEDLLKKFNLWEKGARTGSARLDFSSLFTYRCLERYVKKDGLLGFLITKSLLKGKSGNKQFRNFELESEEIKIVKAFDFDEIKPFEANNNTAGIIIEKDKRTKYPIPYILWEKKKKVKTEATLKKAKEKSKISQRYAIPSSKSNPLSPWLTLPPMSKKAAKAVYRALGKCLYEAREGINSGGLNSAYFLDILEIKSKETITLNKLPSYLEDILDVDTKGNQVEVNNILVKNITKGMHKKVNIGEKVIEDFFVYPMIKSRHLKKWSLKGHNYVLQMHDPKKKIGYDEGWVKINFPKTYSYLKACEDKLKSRKSRVVKQLMKKGPFYSMFGVGEYTFSPYKVVWCSMGGKLISTVVGSVKDNYLGEKLIIPEHVLAYFHTDNKNEAHYLCSIINSKLINLIKTSIKTGKGSIKLLEETLKIPEFDPENEIHLRLSELAMKAHELMENYQESNNSSYKDELKEVEEEIEDEVRKLYGITDEEFSELKEIYEEYL